jgi:hypothetical protein
MSFTAGSSVSGETDGTTSTHGQVAAAASAATATGGGGTTNLSNSPNPGNIIANTDTTETTEGTDTTGNKQKGETGRANASVSGNATTVKVIDSTTEKLRIQHLSKLPGNRFERISSLLKTFKLTCGSWTNEQWTGLHMQLPEFTAVIEPLTVNSYVMVLCADSFISEYRVPSTSTWGFPEILLMFVADDV